VKNFLLRLSLFFILSLSLWGENSLWWWEPAVEKSNFGDALSQVIVEKIIGKSLTRASVNEHKLLAVGSILQFAKEGDVIWGSGIHGRHLLPRDYRFSHLDVRSVRGPLTRAFLTSLGIDAPAIYGDPALLLPLLFPEFKVQPIRDYIVIPHISEIKLFLHQKNAVFPTEPWREIVQKIIESKLVISSSLHGIVVAEAFGIPARFLRVTDNEPLFKYKDYYQGTNRFHFHYATSVEEALRMGGEKPGYYNLDALIAAFPYDFFQEK